MDKIDKLLDAVEHPERYTNAELEAMLADPEVRKVYDVLDKSMVSLTPISTPDVDAEWKAFERVHRKHKFRTLSLFQRNVAAGVALCVASILAVAAVVGVSVNYIRDKKAKNQAADVVTVAQDNIVKTEAIVDVEEIPVTPPETIVFDNEPLEIIIGNVAEYYGYKAEFSSETPKELRLYFRWNQEQTLDEVVESLNNFEQIHITVKDKTIKID